MKAILSPAALAACAMLSLGIPATAQLYTCIGQWGSTCNSMAPNPSIFDCNFASQHASNPDGAAAQQLCQSHGGVLNYHRLSSTSGNQCGYTIDQVNCMTAVVCTGQYAAACNNVPSNIPAPSQTHDCNFALAHPDLDQAVAQQYCAQGTNLGVVSYHRLTSIGGNQCGYVYDSVTCGSISNSSLWPRYYILTLIYAPPGCGDATHTCTANNTVVYSQDSSTGTATELEQTAESGNSLDVKVGDDTNSVGAGFEANKTYTNNTTETITRSGSAQLTVNGQEDGVNHDLDQFTILLNPVVAASSVGNSVTWYMGWRPISGFSPPLTTPYADTVYVYELKHPALMRPGIKADFQHIGLTTADYATILAQDPYANSPAANPPAPRYAPTTLSFEYEPPLPTDPNICANGVCTCNSLSGGIKNDFETEQVASAAQSYKVSVTVNAGVQDIFSLTAGSSLTFGSTSTTTHTTSHSEGATADISCPSAGYTGPNHIAVYWDTIYGSFLFVPQGLSGGGKWGVDGPVVYQGLVTYQGRPIARQQVELTVGKVTYRTTTNNKGEYVFRSNVIRPETEQAVNAQVSVHGVRRIVTLGAATVDSIELGGPLTPGNPARPDRQSACLEGQAFIPGKGCVMQMHACPEGTQMAEGECVKQTRPTVPYQQPVRSSPGREAPSPDQKNAPAPRSVACRAPFVPSPDGMSCGCPQGTLMQEGECVKQASKSTPYQPTVQTTPSREAPASDQKGSPAARPLACRAPFVLSPDGTSCACPEGTVNRAGACVKIQGKIPPPK